MELSATGYPEYEVIDAGDGLRLERLGDVVISRQCAQAVWNRALSEDEWERRCHSSHYRMDQGAGSWTTHRGRTPDEWPIRLDDMVMHMRLTAFGHIGMFAEQQVQWSWIRETLASRPGASALNLFAYTGGSTLAAALGGAQVTHLDAVKGIVSWARKNAESSGLADKPIRWIVDDALQFCEREHRRGRRYDAIILDPPTFGRGPKGSVWKIEERLPELMAVCERLLSDDPLLVLLSGHTPGHTAAVMRNALYPLVKKRGGTLVSGDMIQKTTASDLVVPAGVYCRWTPG